MSEFTKFKTLKKDIDDRWQDLEREGMPNYQTHVGRVKEMYTINRNQYLEHIARELSIIADRMGDRND